MSEDLDIDKVKFPIKTVITIIGFVGQFMYLYFTMTAKIEDVKRDTADAVKIAKSAQDQLSAANLQVLTYKVDQINNGQIDINRNIDELKKLVSRINIK